MGGHIINNLRYADDTVLIARNETELQKLVDRVVTESNNKGLSLNIKKTEVMTISKKHILPKCTITVNETELRQVQQFKYLGVLVTSDGRCRSEIKSRIGQAKTSFLKMKSIICNNSLSIPIRMRVIQCYIEPILTYGCESWTMNTQIEKSLMATEMWFYRRMMRIPWTAKMTNVEVLNQIETQRRLIINIRKRQSSFFGHVMRRGGLEHIVTTGKIEGRRDRGRQREKILDSLTSWHGRASTSELIANTNDRDLWRSMIAYASRHGT